ncbi:UNVERIFIED_CONTAM: putative pentatricopeptide repeat-containing protein [Sesamum angustifolium]|uniref:Pentatricopeptide repeat-containing protein n=1 Tax=Sesamum angustifolium TaxID=2727405 RepID=A0AAW2M6C3_9LAMI
MLANLALRAPFASRIRATQNCPLFPQQISRCFQAVLEKGFATWTSLIPELAAGGQLSGIALRKASQLFCSASRPNAYTLVHLTRACSNTGLFSYGEQLHCHILKSGFSSNVFVSTALINFYVKFEHMHDAYDLFVEIPEPSVVSWNSLISGYVRSGQFRKALKLFVQLDESDLCADSYSFTAALSACGQLSLVQVGRSVHSKIVKYGVQDSIVVSNCLIDMYGKCGYVAEAMKVFGDMIEKDFISWNSVLAANARNGKLEQAYAILHQVPNPDTISYNELIDGIARHGVIEDAIAVLSEMPNPNSSSWNSIITGYYVGSLTHCCVLISGLDGYVTVGSALIDMYFKCGQIKEAERLFQSLPERNLVTWNALISGYAHNGNSEKVANQYFEAMMTDYMIDPMPEHCSLMIRLMGQEGNVSKAMKMINDLGYNYCGMVWKALLSACVTCGNIKVAEMAARKVIELEGDNEFVYVMMSNIYAGYGKWADVSGIRKVMKERNIKKYAGCSWIQVEDATSPSLKM